jgi:hypothetical protein
MELAFSSLIALVLVCFVILKVPAEEWLRPTTKPYRQQILY